MKIVDSIRYDGDNSNECVHFGNNDNIIGSDDYDNVDIWLDGILVDVIVDDFIVKFEDGKFGVLRPVIV